jgi:hypothetical protein
MIWDEFVIKKLNSFIPQNLGIPKFLMYQFHLGLVPRT